MYFLTYYFLAWLVVAALAIAGVLLIRDLAHEHRSRRRAESDRAPHEGGRPLGHRPSHP